MAKKTDKNSDKQFEIPPEMRAFTEKSVEQAKKALDGFMSAAHRTVSTLEGHAETTRKDAKNLGEKAVTFAEENIASSFDFAQKLVRAKNVEDMLKLQADYIKAQMQALGEQAKALGGHTGKMAKDAASPKKR
jgi:phasin